MRPRRRRRSGRLYVEISFEISSAQYDAEKLTTSITDATSSLAHLIPRASAMRLLIIVLAVLIN